MGIWMEFRSHVLPWLLAGGVIGLMSYQEKQRTDSFNAVLMRQAQAIEAQNSLLRTQGYLVPPALPSNNPELEFGGYESQ